MSLVQYEDGTASALMQKAIQQHLQECDFCKEEYEAGQMSSLGESEGYQHIKEVFSRVLYQFFSNSEEV